MKKSTIYFAIQRFQKDGLIEKNDRRSSEIFFKQDKFDYYLALLKNLKQHIEKK
jgi:DNA-binding PadR family transcriptional regulator